MPGYGTVNLGFDSTIPTRGIIPGLKDVKLSVDVLNLANNRYNEFQYITAGGLLGGNSAAGYVMGESRFLEIEVGKDVQIVNRVIFQCHIDPLIDGVTIRVPQIIAVGIVERV